MMSMQIGNRNDERGWTVSETLPTKSAGFRTSNDEVGENSSKQSYAQEDGTSKGIFGKVVQSTLTMTYGNVPYRNVLDHDDES